MDLEFFEKVEKLKTDLSWNLPEKKRGKINVVGGNVQSFNTEIKISEFLLKNFPVENVKTVLPDALKNKLPALPNLQFLPSTESGSFSGDLTEVLGAADFNLLLGDFSKNSRTRAAVAEAVAETKVPTILTRDTVDLIAAGNPEKLLQNENLIFIATMPQLQALFRAVFYPKILILSDPLLKVAENFHKFTLSYPVKIMTLISDQILLAENGEVKATALSNSGLSPFLMWQGEFAAKIMVYNLFSPEKFFDASLSAIFKK